ncbi:glycosyl transferase [Bacteroidia bacterium]|nr:glycosyl transferase [Bacteroidia bacterium]
MLISIVLPCYNEEAVIAETYKQLTEVLQKNGEPYELVFVNDGSKDRTLPILKGIAAKDKAIKIVSFSRNFGHENATTAGLNHCSGDVAVMMDADLQDPPKVIPEMLTLMRTEGANVVYGARKKREGEPRWRLFAIRTFYRILGWLSDIKLPYDAGDFRAIDRKVIDQFNDLPEKNKYVRGLITWVGGKQIPYYYDREPRFAGETKMPFHVLLKFGLTGIFYFSKKPLNVANSLGIFSIIVGLLYALWAFFSKILDKEYVIGGWTSTVMMLIFFGGVQLLTIGILGKYIGNIFDETKSRPQYIVDEKINF